MRVDADWICICIPRLTSAGLPPRRADKRRRRVVAFVVLLTCWLCTLWLNSVSRISFLLPLLLTSSQIMSGYLDLEVSQWLAVQASEDLG